MFNKVLLILILTSTIHSGRTDSRGGHRDNINGGYHYHHGYPAHSHSGGCPYDSSYSSSDNNLGSTIFYIIIGFFILLFIYVYISDYLDKRRNERLKVEAEKQRIIDEKVRIRNLVEGQYKDRIRNQNSIETKIKHLIKSYNESSAKDKYWIAFRIGKQYLELAKLKDYNKKESEKSVKWINISKDHILDLENRNKKINKTELKLKVDYTDLLYVRARANSLNDKYNALVDYDYIIENLDDSAEAYFERALLKKEIGSYDSAFDDINFYLKNKKENHRAYFERAMITFTICPSTYDDKTYRFIRDDKIINHIIKDLEKSILLEPIQTDSYTNKATIEEYDLEDSDKAIKTLSIGIKNNPDNPKIMYSRAHKYYHSNKLDLSKEDLDKLLEYEPDNMGGLLSPKDEYKFFGYAYWYRSRIYGIRGNMNMEINDLRNAMKYNIDSAIKRYLEITKTYTVKN